MKSCVQTNSFCTRLSIFIDLLKSSKVVRYGRLFFPLSSEQTQRNRFAHGPITSRRGMQVVAAIVARQESVGMLRVAHHTVEIENSIEVPVRTNPLVHSLPGGLAQRSG